MPAFVACKLPHGLTIRHEGQTLNLNGPSESVDPLNPSPNGVYNDSASTSGGFGLTELNDEQSALFDRWSDAVTYKKDKDGKISKTAGKLDEPFLPLANGSIIKFASEDDARAETRSMGAMVTTGFEGLDGEDPGAGVEKADSQPKPALRR